jgi:sugar transferase (PEP-CTERM/EpsH1 system associated)
VAALERTALSRCEAVLVVSEAEAKALGPATDQLLVVGNGVDTEYFAPPGTRPDGPPSLIFTGTMDYRPNVDGVSWFVREVWPALRQAAADLSFTIVGRDPAPEVRRLAEVPGVVVTGTVRDVRPYLAAAGAVVVPLRIARGVQNKVLEAMAMGCAVVASGPALQGLDVRVGTEVLRADSPGEWQAAVLGLLADEARRRALGRAARQGAVSRYNWTNRMAPLVAVCTQLAGGGRSGMALRAESPRGEAALALPSPERAVS